MPRVISTRKMMRVIDPQGNSADAMSVITIRNPFQDHFDFMKVTPLFPLSVLSRFSELSADIMVMFWFMAVLGKDAGVNSTGWIYAPAKDLHEDLGLSNRTMFRALQVLSGKKPLLEKKGPRASIYRLVPDLVMKGSLQRIKCSDSASVIIPSDKTRAEIRRAVRGKR